jgi:hypothetical protein
LAASGKGVEATLNESRETRDGALLILGVRTLTKGITMSSSNVIDLNQAHSHLENEINNSNISKLLILHFIGWIGDWDKTLSSGNHIFPYKRETNNVAFAIDRDRNIEKQRTSNFLVIKLAENKDREFNRELHFDFELGADGYANLAHLITRRSRPEHHKRWVVTQKELDLATIDDLRALCLHAFRQRGGIF